jgi:hypothetical protein
MPFTAEQHSFLDPPSRLLLLEASQLGIPFQALHRYVGPSATMRVEVAALLPVVDATGPEMDQGETVTLLNDMCVLAPATLIDRSIRGEEIDARTVRATFSNAAHTARAELSFDGEGKLTGFWSDDRLRASPDGRTFTRTHWSTPVGEYRAFGPRRIATRGVARWQARDGEFAYLQVEIVDVSYNVGRAPVSAAPRWPWTGRTGRIGLAPTIESDGRMTETKREPTTRAPGNTPRVLARLPRNVFLRRGPSGPVRAGGHRVASVLPASVDDGLGKS